MILELVRPVSFLVTMLSHRPVMPSTFYVPGARREEPLWLDFYYVPLLRHACCRT
jgi:hypothetical protein